ncbi:ABC-2 transporter permease [Pseudoxanthomonas sp. CAU 1598]|uniref:ABC-2 transporter permease n=1 Tax=Pseudomarimonas arenosa TaxID=2774145 RepID=A0AAW3ZN65_9GAMM|nr:ABC-2 transporter permease [Pseudomarimonas arenosa]MBD8527413.1 ABC-2 transporter permease [Pseudomarimonas arenosa]
MTRVLIAKDLRFYRSWIVATVLVGVVALWLSGSSEAGGGPSFGFILFMTAVIAFGVLLSMLGIYKERQDRSHLFVLSLPITPAQYMTAKVWAATIAFLVPWVVLTGFVLLSTLLTARPDGGLPFFVALMLFFLLNFFVLLAIVVVSLSEVWSIAAILLTNLTVTPMLSWLYRLTEQAQRAQAADAWWSADVLAVMAAELLLAAIALGLALTLPSRRRDLT